MSESFIEPESLNSTLVSLDAILDEDGAVRLLNKELSSYNFDGVIPTTANTILVSQLEVGMSFLPIGETEGALRTVVKVEFDDPQMTSSPTNNYIISYLSANGDIESVTYDGSQNIEVYFEDWDDKVLGTKGWLITQEGNAIFSNVAVRGRIEATEGLIDGDLIVTGSLSTSETADTTGGIVFDSDGIFAYNTSGTQTFSLDSATGDVTIFGTPGNDLLIGSDLSDTGTTVISANRITTGSVTGRVFRSNSSMTPTSGTGIYLDGNNNVRFSDPDATFTFNSSGLNITNGSNATLTFNSTGLSISGAGVTIGGTNPDNFITGSEVDANITQIDGGKITTGIIDSNSPVFVGTADGENFSTQGMAINLNNGTITSEQFRINTNGNAYFSGNLSAAGGTFSGALSAATGTFTGALVAATGSFSGVLSAATGTFSGALSSGVSITSPNINGGSIVGTSFISNSISGKKVQIGAVFPGVSDSRLVFYDDFASTPTQNRFWQLGMTSNRDLTLSYDQAYTGTTRTFTVAANFEVIGLGNINGNGSGLYGTATSLVVGRATDANNLDSGATGGARITGNNVLVTSIGSGTTSDETLRRNSSNQMRAVAASSRKIKTDISLLEDLDVLNIDVVKYKYIDGYLDETDQRKDKLIPGFIAEQVYEFLPIAVDLDSNGDPKNWNERIIIPIMVKTIQDQQKLINELKERIERLESNG